MSDKIITFKADPPVTRWIYLQTVVIIFVATQVTNFFAQSKLVHAVNWKHSFIICAVLSLLIAFALTRTPLTKSLTIDYDKRLIIVGFAALTRADNSLEIPFERLGVKTGATATPTSSAPKWKTSLLLDGKEIYLLLSSESGFSPEQMNEFNERVKGVSKESL